jgi:hypothetical protein
MISVANNWILKTAFGIKKSVLAVFHFFALEITKITEYIW